MPANQTNQGSQKKNNGSNSSNGSNGSNSKAQPTVIQVPAENVTVTKGGKRRRLHGGVASVQFDLPPLVDPDQDQEGGRRRSRSRSHKGHKRRTRRARK